MIKPKKNSSRKIERLLPAWKDRKRVHQKSESLERRIADRQRWQVGTLLSTFKRSLGEYVTSILPFAIINEVLFKVSDLQYGRIQGRDSHCMKVKAIRGQRARAHILRVSCK